MRKGGMAEWSQAKAGIAGEELARVFVLRIRVDCLGGGGFDDFAAIHDEHVVADVLDHGEIVRDEEVGEAELLLEVLEEIDDLRLHADVERADRFVADDESRLHGERAGDADALALAAAEFVRVAVHHLRLEADLARAVPPRGRAGRRGSFPGNEFRAPRRRC